MKVSSGKNKNIKLKIYLGGSWFVIKTSLAILSHSLNDILLVKISKGYINAAKCFSTEGVYNGQKHSSYTKRKNCNAIDRLGEQLGKFSSPVAFFNLGIFQ